MRITFVYRKQQKRVESYYQFRWEMRVRRCISLRDRNVTPGMRWRIIQMVVG